MTGNKIKKPTTDKIFIGYLYFIYQCLHLNTKSTLKKYVPVHMPFLLNRRVNDCLTYKMQDQVSVKSCNRISIQPP